MPPLTRHYLTGSSQRSTFEALHARALDLSINTLDDLVNHLPLTADLITQYLGTWFYNETPILFDRFINLSKDQLAESYQLATAVYQLEDTDGYLEILIRESLLNPSPSVGLQHEITIPATVDMTPHENEPAVTETSSPASTDDVEEEKLDGAPDQFDAHYLLSILDLREIIIPITLKRVIWWMALLACIGGITYKRDEILSGLKAFAEINSIPLMLLLYLYEPLLYALELITTPKYPEALPNAIEPMADLSQLQALSLNPERPLTHGPNSDLAIIIPCHNSAEFIADTIKAALRHVAPSQIFLMDNGRGLCPSDLTKKVAHNIDRNINYFWLPKIASKNWAQLFALQYINEHRPELSLTLLIDDDTLIPSNFTIRRDFLLDPGVQAIAYPIRAISPYKKQPLLVRWQDREYVKSDLHKLDLDQAGALDCAHGAAAVIRREALWKILTQKHNGQWYGEDLRNGYELEGGWRLDLNCYFDTLVPQTLLGKPLNLYHQRVRAWDQALLLFPWSLALKPLLTMRKGSALATLKLKNSQLYTIYSALMQIFRYPLMGLILSTSKAPQVLGIWAGINVVDMLLGLCFNYLKLPGYLRSDLLTMVTVPIYKGLLSVLGTVSFLRVLFITGSITQHPRSLGFQLGHGKVVIDQASLAPRPYDDDTIVQHLLPPQEIVVEAQTLIKNHALESIDNPMYGENVDYNLAFEKLRDWDRKTAGLNPDEDDDLGSDDTIPDAAQTTSTEVNTAPSRQQISTQANYYATYPPAAFFSRGERIGTHLPLDDALLQHHSTPI